MNSANIHLIILHLVVLQVVTNSEDSGKPDAAESCANLKALNGIIHIMDGVTVAMGDILASAKVRAANIADNICVTNMASNSTAVNNSSFNGDFCIRAEHDCNALYQMGFTKNGLYRIWPKFLNQSIQVYCDMETDGGGWTMFQRRGEFGEPHISFFETWDQYKKGFGDLRKEFWLGNDVIFALTNQADSVLRIDLEDFDGQKRYAKYQNFLVRSEIQQYKMTIGPYTGNAGDSLRKHDDKIFGTKDSGSPCAKDFKGGWWYAGCHEANLNGVYHHGDHTSYADGINWFSFRGFNHSMKNSEMKIRPCIC